MTKTRADQIFEAFVQFHKANPHIWELFKKYTFQAINAGREHYGSACIFERIRWHLQVETSGGDLKLNNNFRAYYARLFHVAYPNTDGFFQNRKLVSEEVSAAENDQQEFPGEPPGDETALNAELAKLL